MLAMAQKQTPEVPSFPCVDPVETAADKLSALAWRVCVRDRARAGDDPTIIRHLHDLATLERHVASAPGFARLVLTAVAADEGRGGVPAMDASAMLAEMMRRLETDPLWAREYEEFVRQVTLLHGSAGLGAWAG
jgi:nucleotidyltransferase AbiEii toxin of type IV toxin-antitoxin system